ncbi:hypothetical protein Lal_00029019 [Lupinus albus]|uniref:Putative integrator complex subunit 7 n=1 Tax=Lupinus albus TaxID=3870 RepID=A0A6A5NQI9_LUPAL|nr:putative integrator complex subunit 7 [Lupinus albus]KAF1885130.1 hypothetical protein Lal_00029019 [Lupinus albus]
MATKGCNGDEIDDAATTNRYGSYLWTEIESIIREASPCEVMEFTLSTTNQGPLKEENSYQDLQESPIHELTGTRQSAIEPTCAACSMEWSIHLEKGLRSSKPGVRVQAILQMGPRLQQWSMELECDVASNSMPGLVPGEDRLFANAILLRLADAFRGGDKEIRLSVVKVFLLERKHRENRKHKQCKGLLSKARVANHLELLNRVKSVYDSGDLESKALALVLFGCWADFSSDNAQIRYLILSSLICPHDCEAQASVFAAGCFCEISDDFACITMEMLFNMMNSPAVTLPVKLTAAQVFARFKCSYSTAIKAFKTGLVLVMNSSDEDFSVAMLFSLSELASNFTLLTSNQVDFLGSFLSQERTSRLQETTLRCLRFLFQKGRCEYPVEHLSSLAKCVTKPPCSVNQVVQDLSS